MLLSLENKKKIFDNVIQYTISDYHKPKIKWIRKTISGDNERYIAIVKITKKKSIYLQLIKKRHVIYLDIYIDIKDGKMLGGKIEKSLERKSILTLYLSTEKRLILLYGYIKYDNIPFFKDENYLDEYIYNLTINKDILWNKLETAQKDNIEYIAYDLCIHSLCVVIILDKYRYNVRNTLFSTDILSWTRKTPKKLFDIIQEYQN